MHSVNATEGGSGKKRSASLALGTVLVALVLTGLSPSADAATVLNRFQRSCNFGMCSPFVQSNPPYDPTVGSDCVTKSYTGQAGEYYRAPGIRC